ncbi:ATP-binding protein [Nonomuraea ferruginea]
MAEELETLLSRDFDLESLISLRREVERHSEEEGLAGLALYRFVVAVNEITTNSVRHGGGHGRLTLWKGADRLYCEVTDRGRGLPPAGSGRSRRRPPAPTAGACCWPGTAPACSASTATATAPASCWRSRTPERGLR